MLDASIASLTTLARNWWALMLRGAFAILFGLIAWFWPGLALNTLILLFAAYALAGGLLGIVSAIRSIDRNLRWLPLLIEGLISIGAGLIALLWPGLAAKTFLYVIAIWAIVSGVFEIAAAIRLRREISNEWMLGLSGVAGIVFGVVAIARPLSGALAVLWLIGLASIFIGVLLMALGWRLRGLRTSLEAAATRAPARQATVPPSDGEQPRATYDAGVTASSAAAADAGLVAAAASVPPVADVKPETPPAESDVTVDETRRAGLAEDMLADEAVLSTEGEGEGAAEAEQPALPDSDALDDSATMFDGIEQPEVLDDESEQELFAAVETDVAPSESSLPPLEEPEAAVMREPESASPTHAEVITDTFQPDESNNPVTSATVIPAGEAVSHEAANVDETEGLILETSEAADVEELSAVSDLAREATADGRSAGQLEYPQPSNIADDAAVGEAETLPGSSDDLDTSESVAGPSSESTISTQSDAWSVTGEAPEIERAETDSGELTDGSAPEGEGAFVDLAEPATGVTGAETGIADDEFEAVEIVGESTGAIESIVGSTTSAESGDAGDAAAIGGSAHGKKDTTGLSRSERELQELFDSLPPEGSGWRRGDGTQSMPDGFAIKGNASSRIYHMPGGRSYDATIPEIWFAQADDARAAGFRPRSGDPTELELSLLADTDVASGEHMHPVDEDEEAETANVIEAVVADDVVVPEEASEPATGDDMMNPETDVAESPARPPRLTVEEQRLARLIASLPPEGSGWVRGDGSDTCPPGYSIKGNASSRIYHVVGGQSYADTVPEICFATPDDATAAGFRARKGDPPFMAPENGE